MMKRFQPVFALALIAVLTVASGVMHGRMSNRWGKPADMEAAAKKLDGVPDQFGDWQLLTTGELHEVAAETLETAGSVTRAYVNEETGESVHLGLLLGPAGPISVHTPDVCYSSRDFTRLGQRERVTVELGDGTRETFWCVTFQTNDLSGSLLRVYYGWSGGDQWSAPDQPRLTYGGNPYLYKIDVTSRMPPGTDFSKVDPCREFLKYFVPASRNCLVPPSED